MTDINQRTVPVRPGDSLVSITMLGHPGIGGDVCLVQREVTAGEPATSVAG